MKKTDDVGIKLRRGDKKYIAELTGYSEGYVRQVFGGYRKNKKIMDMAEKLIRERESFESKLKS